MDKKPLLDKKPSINNQRQTQTSTTAARMNVVLFLLLLTGLSLGNLLTGEAEGTMPGENRLPQPQPSLSVEKVISGSYTRLYDQHVADYFMLRDFFLQVSGTFNSFKGLPARETVELVSFDGANVAQRDSAQPGASPGESSGLTLQETGTPSPEAKNPEEALTAVDNFGQLLVVNDRAMEIHRHNEEAIGAYAQVLNDLQALLPDTQVYSLMVPTQVQFVENEDHRSLSHDQAISAQLLEDLLTPGITSIYVFQALGDAPQEEVYFRTDHHWTARGAYLAYAAFMEQTRRQPLSLEAYELVQFHDFLGSLYHATRHQALARSPETLEVFIPPGDLTYCVYPGGIDEAPYQSSVIALDQYDAGFPFGVFLGGDQPLSIIQGTANNGRSLLVVKDSYGNPFIPFLLPHYEKIHVIDPRLTDENLVDYVMEQQVDEVLFLNYVLVNRYMGYVDLLKPLVPGADY